MNTKMMKKLFDEYAHPMAQDWAEFQQLATFTPTDSYDECMEKLSNVLIGFPSEDTKAWRYFQAIYDDIPLQHRMPLLLEAVYQSHSVDYPSMLSLIADYLRCQETDAVRAERIAATRAVFGDAVDKVTLYRCVMEGDLLPRSAVEFTSSKEDAECSYEESDECFGGVYCCEIDIEDILYCSENNKVFIVPEDIKSGFYGYSGDLGVMTLNALRKDFPDEYDELSTYDRFEELCDYPLVRQYIAPDRRATEIPKKDFEAWQKGYLVLDDKWFRKHAERVKKEYQKKLADEYTRYLMARQAV